MSANKLNTEKVSSNPEITPEQADENKEPQADHEKERPLVADKLKKGLSLLSRTADNRSYVYVSLQVKAQEITRLYDCLERLEHIRYLNLSGNGIADVSSMGKLKYLREAILEDNKIESMDFLNDSEVRFDFLDILSLKGNRLKSFTCSRMPKLHSLNLTGNQLERLDVQNLPALRIFEARKNKLQSIEGVAACGKLAEVYVAENAFRNLDSFRNSSSIKVLHVRDNAIESLFEADGYTASADDSAEYLPNLERLNIRANKLKSIEDLRQVHALPSLNRLNFLANSFMEGFEGDVIEKFVETVLLNRDLDQGKLRSRVHIDNQQS